ncbi:MAG: penicillin-binding protein 2 [Myxococcota bacterium]
MRNSLEEARRSRFSEGPGELRIWPMVALVVAIFTIFILRLFQLQIVEGAVLASRSQANSVRTVRLEAQRGSIVDRFGRTIAASRPAYSVDLIPYEIKNPWRTYSVLAAILDRDPKEIAAKVGQQRGRRRFKPISLSKDLGLEARAQIATHRYAMPGVELYQKPLRDYVHRRLAAQLLGMTGEVSAKELESEKFSNYRAGEIVGKTGLEAAHEGHLRGHAGGVNLIVDVAGREIDEIDRREPSPGGRLVLSIDLDLQQVAEALFRPIGSEVETTMGALVALDPRNGDVLALVSAPSYDANEFSGGIDRKTWRTFGQDPWRPLQNRAIAGVYPPGSTYKAFVAIAGLAEGLIDADTIIACPGHFELGQQTYRCWKRTGHGPVDLMKALAESCDVYFYELGRKLGVESLARYARIFGFGKKTGIGIQSEASGLVPTPEWKMRVRKKAWMEGETISLSIGQGANLTTPIQLAVAYAAIANGGRLVEPRVVLRRETWDGVVVEDYAPITRAENLIAAPILDLVKAGLLQVVTDPNGTGGRARVPGISVAGKSGTTQVVSLGYTEGLEPLEIPIRYRDHALFAAFAPAESPEIVVVAIAEHSGGAGGSVAAPMVQKVMAKYFEKSRAAQSEIGSMVVQGGLQ